MPGIDARAPERSLVRLAFPPRENRGQLRRQGPPFEAHARRLDRVVQAERVHGNFAAVIGSIAGQQTGLQRDEGRRRRCIDCRVVGHAGRRFES